MKKSVVLFVAAFSTLLATQTTRADVLANWTFQTPASTNNIIGSGLTVGTTQSGVLADIGIGTASAFHATAATAWSSPSGNGSSNAWSANNWLLGDYYQFTVSSVGFQNITIAYDQVGSATGPGHFDFEYSTDGSTFTPVGSIYNVVSSPSWNPNTASGAATQSFSYDLSLITALNNLSTAYFRIVDQSATTGGAVNGGNVGTGGTGRVDNFIVNATPVPEPSTIALAVLGGLACLVGLRRKA
jgi:hypothetical protein